MVLCGNQPRRVGWGGMGAWERGSGAKGHMYTMADLC